MTPTSSNSPSEPTAPTSPPISAPTEPPTEPPTLPSDPVEQAKADLVAHLRVDPAQVTVVSTGDVTWRDGSLGCPEPGMFYTQALIPGTRTILEVAGKQYHYHSVGGRAPFRCENPQPPVCGGSSIGSVLPGPPRIGRSRRRAWLVNSPASAACR